MLGCFDEIEKESLAVLGRRVNHVLALHNHQMNNLAPPWVVPHYHSM